MLLALLLADALADEPVRVDFEIWLPTRAEPGPFGWSDKPNVRYFGRPVPPGADGDVEGTTAEDGKLSVGCGLTRGMLQVEVSYVPSRYPEHLPEELQCRVGHVDAHVRIVPRRPLYTDPAELAVDPVRGADVRRHEIGRHTMSEGNVPFALSPDVAWVAQEAPARRGRRRWADTTCTVQPGERPVLVVHHSEAADDDSGSCALVDADGVTHEIPVHLRSLPKAPVPTADR